MSSGQQMPPWLQEQLAKMQQSQQNLQSIMAQKQQLEIDHLETEKALDELKKAGENDDVYKHAGSILIKSTKKDLIEDLEERKELTKTRSSVLSKQEEQVKQSLKEQESKITEMMKGQTTGSANTQPPSTQPPSTQPPSTQPPK